MHDTMARTLMCLLLISCISNNSMTPNKWHERREKTASLTFHDYSHGHKKPNSNGLHFVLDERAPVSDNTQSTQAQHEWVVNVASLQASLAQKSANEQTTYTIHPPHSSNAETMILPNAYDQFHQHNTASKRRNIQQIVTTNNVARTQQSARHESPHSTRSRSNSSKTTTHRHNAPSTRVGKRRSSGHKSPHTKSPHRSSHNMTQQELTILQHAIANNDSHKNSTSNAGSSHHTPHINIETTQNNNRVQTTAPSLPQPDAASIPPHSPHSNPETQQQRPRSASSLPSFKQIFYGAIAHTSRDFEACTHDKEQQHHTDETATQERNRQQRDSLNDTSQIIENNDQHEDDNAYHATHVTSSTPQRRPSTEERVRRSMLQRIRDTLRGPKNPIQKIRERKKRNMNQ